MPKASPKRKAGLLRTARYLLEYAAFRLVGLLVAILPIEMASGLMGRLWRMAAPSMHRHPRALAHLSAAFPERSREDIEAIAADMWEGLGRTFAESFMIDRIVRAGRVSTDVQALLEAVRLDGRGAIFVSLHTGNFELGIVPTLEAGIKCAGVYQRIRNPFVDRYSVKMRRSRYPRGMFARDPHVGRLFLRIVRDGGAVAMLADLRDRRGVSVPFFARPAPSTPFPAFLARTTGAPIIIARVVRLPGVRFRIEAETYRVPVTGDREADVLEGTAAIQARFEAWIRENPSQWMWAHRRWG